MGGRLSNMLLCRNVLPGQEVQGIRVGQPRRSQKPPCRLVFTELGAFSMRAAVVVAAFAQDLVQVVALSNLPCCRLLAAVCCLPRFCSYTDDSCR